MDKGREDTNESSEESRRRQFENTESVSIQHDDDDDEEDDEEDDGAGSHSLVLCPCCVNAIRDGTIDLATVKIVRREVPAELAKLPRRVTLEELNEMLWGKKDVPSGNVQDCKKDNDAAGASPKTNNGVGDENPKKDNDAAGASPKTDNGVGDENPKKENDHGDAMDTDDGDASPKESYNLKDCNMQ